MHKHFSLIGKHALITGSSRGIGYAIAEGLAEAGASVTLNARGKERLEQAESKLKDRGFNVNNKVFDVTKPDEIEEAISELEANAPIDILVNNAGIQIRGSLEDFDPKDWQNLINTNINSIFYMSQAVAKHMIQRGRGKI